MRNRTMDIESDDQTDGLIWDALPGSPRNIDPMLLASYIDGTSGREQRRIVEQAMAADPALAETVAEVRMLSVGEPPAPPDGFRERMIAAVRKARADAGGHGRWRKSALLWAAAAAAAVVFAFAGFEVGSAQSSAAASASGPESSSYFPELEIDLLEG